MNRSRVLLPLLMLALLLALGLRHRLLTLPDVRTASAAGQFDTPRAFVRLARVLGDERPHPLDSAAGDAVRARIVGELARMGISSRITDEVTCNGSADVRTVGCARVRNIVATINATTAREHLLLVSHYDSTPVGPGASDDGIGVSVMLEVAGVLAQQGVKRPVSFLFNEGEEAGLLGARAFMDRDPLARTVTTIVNMDSRGVNGPAIMFETNTPNAPAIDWYRRSVSTPAANSLSTDFSRLIPNTTDVRVFAERPVTILNFAVIGNETKYHSPGDTLASLDGRSVQHMGDQVLGLASAHAAGRGPGTGSGTRVFADLFGRTLLVLPVGVAAAGLGVLLAGMLVLGWRQRRGLGQAGGAVVLALFDAALLSFLFPKVIGIFREGEFWRAHPHVMGTAIMLSAVFATAGALLWLTRKTDDRTLRTGFWLVFVLLGAGISAVAPGASIFFLLPAVFAVTGLLVGGRAERPLVFAGALALLFSWAPLVALVEMLLDYDNGWIFGPLLAIILLPLLIELKVLAELMTRAAMAVLGVVMLAGWATVALLPAYSPDRKQAFGIEYASMPGKPDRWLVVNDGAHLPATFDPSRRFASGLVVPWSTRKRWHAVAHGPGKPPTARAPALALLGTQKTEIGRDVVIQLVANGADSITLIAPPSERVAAVEAGGRRRWMGGRKLLFDDARGNAPDQRYTVKCQGRACDGLRMKLVLTSQTPPYASGTSSGWTIIGSRSGTPTGADALMKARPTNAAPQYSPDATIGVANVRF